jgi:hypothetical protein
MPIYLYLDQKDLINLSNDPQSNAAIKLRQLILSGSVIVVLAFIHVIETWKHKKYDARWKLARYADSLLPLWIANRSSLFNEEIISALCEYVGIPVIRNWCNHDNTNDFSGFVEEPVGISYVFSPIKKSILSAGLDPKTALGINTTHTAESIKSFSDMLLCIERNPIIPEMLLKLHESYPELMSSVKNRYNKFNEKKEDNVDHLISRAVAQFSLNEEELRNFKNWLDLRRCPSLYCYLSVKTDITKDRLSISHPSEMVDLIHIISLPYCDVFSTDKRIHDYIRRSKIHNDLFETGSIRKMVAFKSLLATLDWIENACQIN